jgi:hypothetical protein
MSLRNPLCVQLYNTGKRTLPPPIGKLLPAWGMGLFSICALEQKLEAPYANLATEKGDGSYG